MAELLQAVTVTEGFAEDINSYLELKEMFETVVLSGTVDEAERALDGPKEKQ